MEAAIFGKHNVDKNHLNCNSRILCETVSYVDDKA